MLRASPVGVEGESPRGGAASPEVVGAAVTLLLTPGAVPDGTGLTTGVPVDFEVDGQAYRLWLGLRFNRPIPAPEGWPERGKG